jgi:hypothetical protein
MFIAQAPNDHMCVLLFMALGSKLLFILNLFQQNKCQPKISIINNLELMFWKLLMGFFGSFF